MSKIIGIDLGTSNSAAAVLIGGRPTIIPSAEGTSIGGKAFPSYVAFTKEGQALVGEPAKRQAVTNSEGTITGIKRKMGTDYKVRVIDEKDGTGAVVRVHIETSDGHSSWGTVGVSENIIEASWQALADSLAYGLLKSSKLFPENREGTASE